MPIQPLFAGRHRDLVPGLANPTAAVRDQQLYRTIAGEGDPSAADRIEVESEADAEAQMAIEQPGADDMSMKLDHGGRR